MSTNLVARSGYSNNSHASVTAFNIQYLAEQSAMVSEVAKVANYEVAQIGAHAVGTMAHLVQTTGNVQRQLTMTGQRSEIFDDAHSKVLQVTGQNIITLANAAQKEILNKAATIMR